MFELAETTRAHRVVDFLFTLSLLLSCAAHATGASATHLCANRLGAYPQSPIDWSGRAPLPANGPYELAIADDKYPFPTLIYFSARPPKDLPRDLRRLVRRMKKSSRALTPREHEVGALVARYDNQTSGGVRFTSRRIDHILGLHHDHAINRSDIFPDRAVRPVRHVIHLHTHPIFDNRWFRGRSRIILPSVDDFKLWSNLRAQLRRFHPGVTFEAVVAPAGAEVGNVIFVVTDDDIDRFERGWIPRTF